MMCKEFLPFKKHHLSSFLRDYYYSILVCIKCHFYMAVLAKVKNLGEC